MGFALAPTALEDGYRLDFHERVGSTNAVALDHARTGDGGRLWVVSTRQENGRGRRGRAWATLPGNLAATLLLIQPDLRNSATLGFVAGLALADALAAVAPQARTRVAVDGGAKLGGTGRFELKWPNDVLADGAKLAGILLESEKLADGRFAVAVGIGVNVVSHPDGLPYPATSLSALGAGIDAARLFLALSDAWSSNSRMWNDGRGLARIRDRWLQRAAGLGGEVAVRIDGTVRRGIFETIDEECRFVVRGADGSRLTISAGDVHFGTVASAAAV